MSEHAPLKDDMSYAAALTSVRQAMSRFAGATEEERRQLAEDFDCLQEMVAKLEQGRLEIALFGEISTGKSALINALCGANVTEVDIRGGWTKDIWQLSWEGVGYRIPGLDGSEVVLIDTPGLNEVDGTTRTQMAREAAARADLILFVTDSDLNETEYQALRELAASQKPILLVLNKVDLYSPQQRETILGLLRTSRLAGIIPPENVVSAAADPREVEYVIEAVDGSQRSEWRKPPVHVEEVQARILDILRLEGKALLALNAALYAADKGDRMAALRVQIREEAVASLIWKFASTKAIAVALNPVAVLDVVGGSAVDVSMVLAMARVYGIELTVAGARSLITAILTAAGWVMLSEAAVHVASSIFKGLTLGIGSAVTALPQGAAAGYGSYIVGQAARYYFQHGASWGTDAPKAVVREILKNTDKKSVLHQLKSEIAQRISINRYAPEK